MCKNPEGKSTTAEGCMWVDQETSSCLTQRQGGKQWVGGGGEKIEKSRREHVVQFSFSPG